MGFGFRLRVDWSLEAQRSAARPKDRAHGCSGFGFFGFFGFLECFFGCERKAFGFFGFVPNARPARPRSLEGPVKGPLKGP